MVDEEKRWKLKLELTADDGETYSEEFAVRSDLLTAPYADAAQDALMHKTCTEVVGLIRRATHRGR